MDKSHVVMLRRIHAQREQHRKEVAALKEDYENQLAVVEHQKNILKQQLIEAQYRVRLLDWEVIRKEQQISALHEQLCRETSVRRSVKTKTPIKELIPSGLGESGGSGSNVNLEV